MKRSLILAALCLAFIAAPAPAAPPVSTSLHLQPADVEHVEIDLDPKTTPLVRVYFTNAKLSETQALIKNNLDKPIEVYMQDKLVVAPIIKDPLMTRVKFLKLRFADFDSAAQAAKMFVPTK